MLGFIDGWKLLRSNFLVHLVQFHLQEQLTLGALPPSRFILATLGVLVAEHHAHSLSLLLNSGLLALTQSILRLAG